MAQIGSTQADFSTLQLLVVGYNADAMTLVHANEMDASLGHVAQCATSQNWKF